MWGSHTDMFVVPSARFGPLKFNNVPHILNVAGTRMEVYFSPSDSIPNFLNNLIQTKTTKSLFFCILRYSLSSIENSMHTVFNNGKQIKGVFDLSKLSDSNCAYPRMKGLAVPNTWNPPANVFVDTTTGLLHHKYFIIDANSTAGNKITSTGSYNWDPQATLHNDENSLTIFNARVNNLYYQEFYARYRGAGGETVGTQNISTEIPEKYSLSQNYPNPFNPITKIKFNVSKLSSVKIVVYDVIGREVQTLVNETLKPGTYETSFEGSLLNSGVYFYRLITNSFSETRRMLLVK